MEQLKIKKSILYVAIVTLVALLILLYSLSLQRVFDAEDVNLVQRNIETPIKLWFNGYLGAFFRIKNVGNLNLFVLIALAIAFLRFNKLNDTYRIAIIAFSIVSIVVALKGYFNSRYQMTLLPLFTVITFIFLWLNVLKESSHIRRLWIYGVILAFVGFNSFFFLALYYADSKVAEDNRDSYFSIFSERLKLHLYGDTDSTISSIKKDQNIYKLFTFLEDSIGYDNVILNNNIPSLYYYTAGRYHYYWCGDDLLFLKEGKVPLLENREFEEVYKYLVDSLGCHFIVSDYNYDMYNQDWLNFVNRYGRIRFFSRYNFIVYELIEAKETTEYDREMYFNLI
ncbi:MAG: hypothetical protein KDD29_11100, partial [Flavobacteriales bacterium]|nr:hypothetical protein [Flavobacteriales bacterium]